MNQRIGDWMQTYTGRQFWPMDPRPEEIFIEDIAHHLSMICRFTGAVKQFYSVAQHSVLVSMNCDPEDRLWGLLHDASEAYLIDLARPVKHDPRMHAYREAEDRVMLAVMKRFNLPGKYVPNSVKRADDILLMTERRDLMAPPPVPWSSEHLKPLSAAIDPWKPSEAEMLFLSCFRKLEVQI